MVMNQEIKEKWLAALRSGKYKQGKYRLRTIDDEYCCLGVLCEVVGLEAQLDRFNRYKYEGESAFLPLSVKLVSEISGSGSLHNPIYFNGTNRDCLMTLNDSGMTFEQIADVIEEQF